MELIRASQLLRGAETIKITKDFELIVVAEPARVYNPAYHCFINFVIIDNDFRSIIYSGDNVEIMKTVLDKLQEGINHQRLDDDTSVSFDMIGIDEDESLH